MHKIISKLKGFKLRALPEDAQPADPFAEEFKKLMAQYDADISEVLEFEDDLQAKSLESDRQWDIQKYEEAREARQAKKAREARDAETSAVEKPKPKRGRPKKAAPKKAEGENL